MYKNWMNSRSLNIYFNKEREWWNWCNLFTSCELFFKENSLVANELQHLHLIRSVENVHNLNKTKLRCFCYVFKLKFFFQVKAWNHFSTTRYRLHHKCHENCDKKVFRSGKWVFNHENDYIESLHNSTLYSIHCIPVFLWESHFFH